MPTRPSHALQAARQRNETADAQIGVLQQQIKAKDAALDELQTQIEQLAAFVTRTFPGEPSANEGAVDTAIRLLDRLDRTRVSLNDSLAAANATARAAANRTEEVLAENAALRDELHRMTIENARLQGYRERVREFDPVTEQQEYAQQTRPMTHARNDFEGVMSVASGRRTPWYHRKG